MGRVIYIAAFQPMNFRHMKTKMICTHNIVMSDLAIFVIINFPLYLYNEEKNKTIKDPIKAFM